MIEKAEQILVLSEKFAALKELILQFNLLQEKAIAEYRRQSELRIDEHNKMMQIAIDKALEAMNVRLIGMNEIRDQLKDVMNTRASSDKVNDIANSIHAKIDANAKSGTERFEAYVRTSTEKFFAIEKHSDDKLIASLKVVSDKFENMHFSTVTKLDNIDKALDNRFKELHADYLRPLIEWKSNMQGRGFVLLLIWPIIITLIGYIISHLS